MRYPADPPQPPSEVRERAASYAGEVASRIESVLRETALAYAADGGSFEDWGRPSDLAERMLALIPAESAWSEVLGPAYISAQVAALLGGVSRQAIADRRARRTLLALKTADGHWVYPTAQFGNDRQVLPGLAEILATFDPEVLDEWSLAGWLAADHDALGGRSVFEHLAAGGDLAPVLVLADDLAHRLAR